MDKELLIGLVVEAGFLILSLYMIRKFYFHPEEIQNDLENSLLGEWFDVKANREKNIKNFKRRGVMIILMFLFVLIFFIRDLLRLFHQVIGSRIMQYDFSFSLSLALPLILFALGTFLLCCPAQAFYSAIFILKQFNLT